MTNDETELNKKIQEEASKHFRTPHTVKERLGEIEKEFRDGFAFISKYGNSVSMF